jgi:hypothetical protein
LRDAVENQRIISALLFWPCRPDNWEILFKKVPGIKQMYN